MEFVLKWLKCLPIYPKIDRKTRKNATKSDKIIGIAKISQKKHNWYLIQTLITNQTRRNAAKFGFSYSANTDTHQLNSW